MVQVLQIHNTQKSTVGKLIQKMEKYELFLSEMGEPCITLPVSEHDETYLIHTSAFRRQLHAVARCEIGGSIGGPAVDEVVMAIETTAMSRGSRMPVFCRVGEMDGKVYHDLVNPRWEAIEIDKTGYRVVTRCPVKFRREPGMLELPVPVSDDSGGERLRGVLNLRNRDQFDLIVSWMLGAMSPSGPHPILGVYSEPGSGKSTLTRMLREILDPNVASIRGIPRSEQELIISAKNAWISAYDNVGALPEWISDCLCRLATGGGFSTRKLYTDADEVIFNTRRPVILNGVTDIITRPDLMDRSIIVDLPPVSSERRQTERQLLQEFHAALPGIRGWLLQVMANGLDAREWMTLKELPRMADFASNVYPATIGFMDDPDRFPALLEGNRREANDFSLDSSPIGRTILGLAPWVGTASELLRELQRGASEPELRSQSWPTTPHSVSVHLHRIAHVLRMSGVDVVFTRDTGRQRERRISLLRRPS
ncbi:hypothetical protein [Paludibaculum fermentans]|uniref:hypothetical protein n=1 Tax=Paludibaculum fermentans TaxID=1473598 RepID=UPI003EBFA094